MIRAQLIQKIIAAEGLRFFPYYDTKNKLTVGVGHLVKIGNGKTKGDGIGRTYMTSVEEVKSFLIKDLNAAVKDAKTFVNHRSGGRDVWASLSENRQDAIIEMAYTLGMPHLHGNGRKPSERDATGFTKFRDALQRGDFESASAEILDSGWYNDDGVEGRVRGVYQAFVNDSSPVHFAQQGAEINIDAEVKAQIGSQYQLDKNEAMKFGVSLAKIKDIRYPPPKKRNQIQDKSVPLEAPFRLSQEDVDSILGRPSSKNKKSIRKDSDMDRDTIPSSGLHKAGLRPSPEEYEAMSVEEKIALVRDDKTNKQIEKDDKDGRRKAKKAREAAELKAALAEEGVHINRQPDFSQPGGMLIPSDPAEIHKNTGVMDYSKFKNNKVL